jgi:hypothetical protein
MKHTGIDAPLPLRGNTLCSFIKNLLAMLRFKKQISIYRLAQFPSSYND